MLNVLVEVIKDGILPVQGSDEAACFDAYAREIIKVDEFYYKVKLGFKTDIPKGYKGILNPRSSISDTGWRMANGYDESDKDAQHGGVIDSDYVGEWQIRFRPFDNEVVDVECGIAIVATPKKAFPFKVGERVAQFNFAKVEETKLEQKLTEGKVNKDTERGEGGHGSTGKGLIGERRSMLIEELTKERDWMKSENIPTLDHNNAIHYLRTGNYKECDLYIGSDRVLQACIEDYDTIEFDYLG